MNAGDELYIICGSCGKGGTGSNGYYTTVASSKVTVPLAINTPNNILEH